MRPLATMCLLLALGCTDTEGRYDDFIERTGDLRGGGAGGLGGGGDRIDIGGSYLLALQTPLSATPLYFAADVQVAGDLQTLSLRLQPLSTDAADPPRARIGTVVSAEGLAYGEDGSFVARFDAMEIPGAANPISGSDIVADVELLGSARGTADAPRFCGQVLGMVTVPIQLDLVGSTVGAVPAADFAAVDPLRACPAADAGM